MEVVRELKIQEKWQESIEPVQTIIKERLSSAVLEDKNIQVLYLVTRSVKCNVTLRTSTYLMTFI
jgi:hypothetical protein